MYSLVVGIEPWINAPLIQVSAIVQFDVVLSIKERYASIQDELRAVGFIGSETFQEQTFVQQMSSTGIRFGQQTENFWDYFDRLVHKVFTVNEKQLAYTTSAYKQFDGFLEEFKVGLQAVSNAIQGDVLVRQISLRYTDWMQGTQDLPLEQQLDPRLLGFALEGKHGAETVSIAADGSVTLAFRASNGSLALNALQEFAGHKPLIPRLNITNPPSLETERQFVLDINVTQNDSIEAGSRLMLSEIPEKLQQFHKKASQAFHGALTSEGLKHYRGY